MVKCMPMGAENYKKILIVDDESDNLQLIVESIEEMEQPYNLLLANNAVKAIAIIKDEVPDLIITDWEMPGMDGVDLIRVIKEDEAVSHIPILMCTGVMVSAEHLKAALEAGADDYIRKPFDKIELNARLNTMMKLSENIQKILDINKKKEGLLSIIAHDLRSPLYGIKYLANVTITELNSHSNAQVVDALAQIEGQAAATCDLLNNLLLWIKLPGSTNFYHPKAQSIRCTIEESTNLFRTILNEMKVRLTLSVEDATANFDKELIASVVRNLISNAIKFSDAGGEVSISSFVKGNVVVVKVSDRGVGMSKEQQKRITTPPANLYESNSSRTNGWGVGLKLAFQILAFHNSQLNVESQLGKGTSIWFSLPLSSPSAKGITPQPKG
jgi:two-component system, sensor histidine kinase and response regulator